MTSQVTAQSSTSPAAPPSPRASTPPAQSAGQAIAAATNAIAQPTTVKAGVGVVVEEAAPKKMSAGALQKSASPLLWHYSCPVEWRGEKFKLKIEFPLSEKQKDMDPKEKLAFKHAAKQFADLFVADLLKQLESLNAAEVETVKIFFGPDGYTLTTDEKYDPFNPDTTKKDDHSTVIATNPTSKALSTAITNEKKTAKALLDALKVDTLAPLRETVLKQSAEKSKTMAPAGLKWKDNSCFIHAPFQQLVNEPTIAEDLANSEYYIGGKKNALFRAVDGYRKSQIAGEPFDAASILRDKSLEPHLDASGLPQDALGDGWNGFRQFFVDPIPEESHLHSLFSNPVEIRLEDASQSLSQAAETAMREKFGDAEPPAVFSLQVKDRRTYEPKENQPALSEGISEEALPREAFLKALVLQIGPNLDFNDEEVVWLKQQGIAKVENLHFDDHQQLLAFIASAQETSTKNKLRAHFLRDKIVSLGCENWDQLYNYFTNEPIAAPNDVELAQEILKSIANRILDDDKSLKDACLPLLDNDSPQKKAINDYRANNLVYRYHDQPVAIDPTGKLTINGKKYDIGSFTCYVPDNHFVAYVQKDGKYYRLDDLSGKAESILVDTFKAAAKQAYFYTIREESLSVSASKDATQKPVEPTVKNEALEGPIMTGSTELFIERGSMKEAGEDFALVNPSNTNLKNLHPQLKDVMTKGLFTETVRTNTERDKRWHDWITKPHKARGTSWYSARQDHWYTSGPRPLLTQGPKKIIHTPLPSLTNKDDVEQAVNDILTFAMEHGIDKVAFPVFEYKGTDGDVLAHMKTAIEKFLQTHDWQAEQIKIILPPQPTAEPAA